MASKQIAIVYKSGIRLGRHKLTELFYHKLTSASVTMVAPASLAALEMAEDTEPIPPSTYLIINLQELRGESLNNKPMVDHVEDMF